MTNTARSCLNLSGSEYCLSVYKAVTAKPVNQSLWNSVQRYLYKGQTTFNGEGCHIPLPFQAIRLQLFTSLNCTNKTDGPIKVLALYRTYTVSTRYEMF